MQRSWKKIWEFYCSQNAGITLFMDFCLELSCRHGTLIGGSCELMQLHKLLNTKVVLKAIKELWTCNQIRRFTQQILRSPDKKIVSCTALKSSLWTVLISRFLMCCAEVMIWSVAQGLNFYCKFFTNYLYQLVSGFVF